jgi:rhomboid family protein
MLPLRDHNPSQTRPLITSVLIVVNVVVFLASWSQSGNDYALAGLYQRYAMIPARISSGQGYYTLFTSMFMHAGFFHIGGNMLFLWIFGDNLEDELGHVRFLLFYLAVGIAAGLVQVLASPYSPVPTIGASGAIAGVMGAYVLLYPRARVDVLFIFLIFFKVFSVPAWIMLGLWFAFQLFSGIGSDASSGGVAYWAHAGGFVAGFVLMMPVWLKRGGPGFWRSNSGQPPHPEAQYRMVRSGVPKVGRRR